MICVVAIYARLDPQKGSLRDPPFILDLEYAQATSESEGMQKLFAQFKAKHPGYQPMLVEPAVITLQEAVVDRPTYSQPTLF